MQSEAGRSSSVDIQLTTPLQLNNPLLAMLAAPGKSILRDVYSINRGYEDFANRLNTLGADIETIREI